MKKTVSGFTIVELLIVIVVITVLATISIIAYTGIRERATTAAYSSAVVQWDRFLHAEIAVADTVPMPANPNAVTCLGRSAADFPAQDGFAAGECLQESVNGGPVSHTYYDSTFFDNLKTQAGLPSGLLPITHFTGQIGGNTYAYTSRGLFLYVTSSAYQLSWVPQVSRQCAVGNSAFGPPPGGLIGDYCFLFGYF